MTKPLTCGPPCKSGRWWAGLSGPSWRFRSSRSPSAAGSRLIVAAVPASLRVQTLVLIVRWWSAVSVVSRFLARSVVVIAEASPDGTADRDAHRRASEAADQSADDSPDEGAQRRRLPSTHIDNRSAAGRVGRLRRDKAVDA
jgi:hypothetical protein